jgi:hypothetical protein
MLLNLFFVVLYGFLAHYLYRDYRRGQQRLGLGLCVWLALGAVAAALCGHVTMASVLANLAFAIRLVMSAALLRWDVGIDGGSGRQFWARLSKGQRAKVAVQIGIVGAFLVDAGMRMQTSAVTSGSDIVDALLVIGGLGWVFWPARESSPSTT